MHEMKNTGDRINHKLDITENKNSEFEDTTIETNPNETQTEKIIEKKKWEKYIHSLRDLIYGKLGP